MDYYLYYDINPITTFVIMKEGNGTCNKIKEF